MKIPLMLAIKLVEALSPEEYVGAVSETPTEYTMDLRFKFDDEWCDDDVWAVSKKTGRVRALGGEEGFMRNDTIIWKRDSYKQKGTYIENNGR